METRARIQQLEDTVARLEARSSGRVQRHLRWTRRIRVAAFLGVLCVPVLAYTFTKPHADFQPGDPISSQEINETIDDIYAALNMLDGQGGVSCPADMVQIASWCIDDTQRAAAEYTTAQDTCHALDRHVCTVEAMMACDRIEPAGSECTTTTDPLAGAYQWTSSPRGEGFNAFDQLLAYRDDNVIANQAWWNTYAYYCCTFMVPQG